MPFTVMMHPSVYIPLLHSPILNTRMYFMYDYLSVPLESALQQSVPSASMSPKILKTSK